VKSSAYLQSWGQERLSIITFDIAKKLRWNPPTNTYIPDYPCRCADCNVFCLFTGRDPESANVLDISQWEFYVLPTTTLEERFGEQKSIVLSRIRVICDPVPHSDLKQSIDGVLGLNSS